MMKTCTKATIFTAFITTAIVFKMGTSPPAFDDLYTGLYYVYGSKIVSAGSFSDTTNISSVVVVKMMSEKTDTLHFFGLPGADEGEIKLYNGSRQLKDNAGTLQHYDELDGYKIYGELIDNNFEIHYQRVDNFYKATGVIIQNKIKLQAQYTVRTTTIEYDLAGEKIVN